MRKSIVLLMLFATLIGCQKPGEGASRQEAPPEKEQNTPEQAKAPEQPNPDTGFRKGLWRSPIGQMLREYLYETRGDVELNQLASEISTRAFSSPHLAKARIEALRYLVDDVYAEQTPSEEILFRIQKLHDSLADARIAVDTRTKWLPSMAEALPYLVGVAFLSGSNQLRLQLWRLSRQLFAFLRLSQQESTEAPPLWSLLGPEFFKDYRPGRAYSNFMHSSMAYMILKDVVGTHGMEHDLSAIDTNLLINYEQL